MVALRMDPPGIAMAKLPRSAMAALAASATCWGSNKWMEMASIAIAVVFFFFLREG